MKQILKNKKVRYGFIIATLFFVFFNILGVLREKYHKTEKKSDRGVTVKSTVVIDKFNPLKKWKYNAGSDEKWIAKKFNDSAWQYVNPDLSIDSIPASFKGICFFRCHFKIDSSLTNKTLAITLNHYGASEVYLDGNFLWSFGEVANTKEEAVSFRPNVPVIFSVADTLEHVITVKYCNYNYITNFKKYDTDIAGITFNFSSRGQELLENILKFKSFPFWCTVLFIFFLTLSIVHLLLFLFYRKQVENLYYSIFVFLFSLIAFAPNLYTTTSDPDFFLQLNYNLVLLLILFLISILTCLYSIFKPTHWKKMLIILIVLSLLSVITYYVGMLNEFCAIPIFAASLFVCIEAVRTIIQSIIKKKQGARILGTGVLVFFIFIFILIIEMFVTGGINLRAEDANSQYLAILALFCIISIPLSMSIYLARNVASTNTDLEHKLQEVEELSARSIAQEKEKQLILENQNITLEKQVTERTFEITEQKKIIEEKNKDIIDSINYAKRIQSAMLPEEAAFKAIFNTSFVLYMPRDIVSGDFYYAAEINGNKLIIAADCTGHGVPGALMSMVGCNIINKLTHENKILETKVVLETLHKELRHALKQNLKGSANRDGMDVAAVLVTDKEIIFASANRPLIYFDHKNQLNEIKATKTPVGGSHIEAIEIEQHTITKENVKQFYLFSDGFADQFGGPDGKKLMVSKFKLWLNQIVNLEVTGQQQFLQTSFTAWKQESEQVDDVMVIGIKV